MLIWQGAELCFLLAITADARGLSVLSFPGVFPLVPLDLPENFLKSLGPASPSTVTDSFHWSPMEMAGRRNRDVNLMITSLSLRGPAFRSAL